jgi:hypothetical protein
MALWVQDLTSPEEREQRTKSVIQWYQDPVTKRFFELLENKKKQLDLSETTSDQYDNPNWSHKQAHKNGMRQFAKLIEDLRI